MSTEPISTRRSAWGFDTADAETWKADAICNQTDPEAFFPEKGNSSRAAKVVCRGCPVRDECLEYALDHDERFGIYGGTSPTERRQLRAGRA